MKLFILVTAFLIGAYANAQLSCTAICLKIGSTANSYNSVAVIETVSKTGNDRTMIFNDILAQCKILAGPKTHWNEDGVYSSALFYSYEADQNQKVTNAVTATPSNSCE